MSIIEKFLHKYMKVHGDGDYICVDLSSPRLSHPYVVDFYSCKELPGRKFSTFVYKVISQDGHETGVVLIVIPSLETIELHGNDFGRLTEADASYLLESIKDFS